MLDLDDARWSELSHAYGAASDIPALLRELGEASPGPTSARDEPLNTLWASLCHQATPSDAAYAAAPHLVAIAARASVSQRDAILHLVGAIAAFEPFGATCPSELQASWTAACRRCTAIIVEMLWSWPPGATVSRLVPLLTDLAAVAGQPRLGRILIDLPSGELELECSACGARSFVGTTDADGLDIAPLAWVRRAAPPTQAAVSAPLDQARPSDEPKMISWLASIAAHLGASGPARCIADVGGTLGCGACGSPIWLPEAIDVAARGVLVRDRP